MADAFNLRQQLSARVDEISKDVETIERCTCFDMIVDVRQSFFFYLARNLSSKYQVQKSIDEAARSARELEKLDPSYGRQFRQRIDELRQRLVRS